MSNKITNIRGMRDLLVKDSEKKRSIELIAKKLADNYGYQEINTPIVEYSSVYNKSLGESSDIVNKEMYNFKDEKDRSLSLRPEATAGIARAIASNGLLGSGDYRIPLKFFLFGPMFRYERPQKGRYRQFYQINFEYFSNSSPECDVELISLAYNFLLQIKSPINLHINTLGDSKSRNKFKNKLLLYLEKYKNDLSEDSKKRLYINPLRILDTKNKSDLKIIKDAPKITSFLSADSKKYYENVKSLLENLKIEFKENLNLVRGLDYYKETVFEFKTEGLGNQQDTILGGGRYSGLVKMFGGTDLDGAGWAAGLDRLIQITPNYQIAPPLASIVFKEKYILQAINLVDKLRSSNKVKGYINILYNSAESKQIKNASKLKSKYIIFIEDIENIKIIDRQKKDRPFINISNIEKIINIINVD